MFQCIEKVFEEREWNDYTVCGSNGVTYRHKWELDHHNCQHDEWLKARVWLFSNVLFEHAEY